uniref:Uncharacterized protein n=1 Tax=Octopus bimaculoides TaxID=37653 RepID=A0A0L8ID24_OCTBM
MHTVSCCCKSTVRFFRYRPVVCSFYIMRFRFLDTPPWNRLITSALHLSTDTKKSIGGTNEY